MLFCKSIWVRSCFKFRKYCLPTTRCFVLQSCYQNCLKTMLYVFCWWSTLNFCLFGWNTETYIINIIKLILKQMQPGLMLIYSSKPLPMTTEGFQAALCDADQGLHLWQRQTEAQIQGFRPTGMRMFVFANMQSVSANGSWTAP